MRKFGIGWKSRTKEMKKTRKMRALATLPFSFCMCAYVIIVVFVPLLLNCAIAIFPVFFLSTSQPRVSPSPWLQNSFCKSRDDPELTNILKFSSLLSELPKVQAFWCVCVCLCLQAEMLSLSCTFVPGSCFFGPSAQHFSKTAKVHLICLSFPKSGFLLIDFSFFLGPFSSGTQFRGCLPLDVSQLPKLH